MLKAGAQMRIIAYTTAVVVVSLVCTIRPAEPLNGDCTAPRTEAAVSTQSLFELTAAGVKLNSSWDRDSTPVLTLVPQQFLNNGNARSVILVREPKKTEPVIVPADAARLEVVGRATIDDEIWPKLRISAGDDANSTTLYHGYFASRSVQQFKVPLVARLPAATSLRFEITNASDGQSSTPRSIVINRLEFK